MASFFNTRSVIYSLCGLFSLLTTASVHAQYKGKIAYRDTQKDRTLYDRNNHLGDWDYRTNWRYDRDAYLKGDTRAYDFNYGPDEDRSRADDYRKGYHTPNYRSANPDYQQNQYYYYEDNRRPNDTSDYYRTPQSGSYYNAYPQLSGNSNPYFNSNSNSNSGNYYRETGAWSGTNAYNSSNAYPQNSGYSNVYESSQGAYRQNATTPTYQPD